MEAPADRRFPRCLRLRRGADFSAVFAGRRALRDPILTLCWREAGLEHPRLGLSVGRRLGGAVTRNRLKRVLREVFRQERRSIPAPVDLVAIPRDPLRCADLEAVREAFLRLMRKLERRLAAPPLEPES